MKKTLSALALVLAAALPAEAQSVSECDGLASAANIVEPWESHTRTFADGEVRLALLDAVEPGAVPFHLLLLSPPRDEMGGRMCRVISFEPGFGFTDIAWDDLQATDDPAAGILFHLPVGLWADSGSVIRSLVVSVNQATGTVTADLLDTPPEWVR